MQVDQGSFLEFLKTCRDMFDKNWGSSVPRRSALEHFTMKNGHFAAPPELIQPISVYISQLYGMPERCCLVFGNHEFRFQPYHLAAACAERIIIGDNPDCIMHDLDEFITNPVAKLVTIVSLAGVHINSTITISENVAIVPVQDLPANSAREAYLSVDRWGDPIFSVNGHAEFLHRATAALVLTKSSVPGRQEKASEENMRLLTKEALDDLEITEKCLLALALSGGCSPFRGWTYTSLLHPAIGYNGLSGHGATGTYNIAPLRKGTIDEVIFKNIYDDIAKLSKKNLKIIQLSISRLSRSRSQPSPVDRAIDLGICLEVLLLNDVTGAELGHRLSSRGAWLIGGDVSRRHKIQRTLKAAYDLRSKAVHNGSIKFNSGISLDEAESYASEMARRLIVKGGFPDWDALVLGGDGFATAELADGFAP